MNITRRRLVAGGLAALPIAVPGTRARAQSATTLKISHQFPGGTIDAGDFRDRLVRKFAADVEKRTNGALKFEIPIASPAGARPGVNGQLRIEIRNWS